MTFRALHRRPGAPLILANVWDVASTRAAAAAGYLAVGTSSAAIADAWGYADGQHISFRELHYFVSRIAATTSLPLSVDLEAGYGGGTEQIVDNVLQLAELGVVGINLEDGLVEGRRALAPPIPFSIRIAAIKEALSRTHPDFFLNARTDAYLLGVPDPLSKTLERTKRYAAAGADGVFVPGLIEAAEIEAVVAGTQLPLNLLCLPGLPNFARLAELGVSRISMGDFAYAHARKSLGEDLASLRREGSCTPIFSA